MTADQSVEGWIRSIPTEIFNNLPRFEFEGAL